MHAGLVLGSLVRTCLTRSNTFAFSKNILELIMSQARMEHSSNTTLDVCIDVMAPRAHCKKKKYEMKKYQQIRSASEQGRTFLQCFISVEFRVQ